MTKAETDIVSIVRKSIMVVFVGAVIGGTTSFYLFFRADTLHHLEDEAKILLETASAIRGYTSERIVPKLAHQNNEVFLPETVPSFSAQNIIARIAETEKGISYREASLNPTNHNDLATGFEAELIAAFSKNSELSELSGFRNAGDENVFYLSRPIRLTDKACLRCHSDPELAPPTMIKLYGASNGFNWQLGDVVAIQHVTVPVHGEMRSMFEILGIFVLILVVLFLIVLAAIMRPLQRHVIAPLNELSDVADRASRRNDHSFLPNSTAKEINSLSQAIARLRNSLAIANKNERG